MKKRKSTPDEPPVVPPKRHRSHSSEDMSQELESEPESGSGSRSKSAFEYAIDVQTKEVVSINTAISGREYACLECTGACGLVKEHSRNINGVSHQVRSHFRHNTSNASAGGSSSSGCQGESADHLAAKYFVAKHHERLEFKVDCHTCKSPVRVYMPRDSTWSTEVTFRKFKLDVGIEKDDAVLGGVEIFKTHRCTGGKCASLTDGGLAWIEVEAKNILSLVDKVNSSAGETSRFTVNGYRCAVDHCQSCRDKAAQESSSDREQKLSESIIRANKERIKRTPMQSRQIPGTIMAMQKDTGFVVFAASADRTLEHTCLTCKQGCYLELPSVTCVNGVKRLVSSPPHFVHSTASTCTHENTDRLAAAALLIQHYKRFNLSVGCHGCERPITVNKTINCTGSSNVTEGDFTIDVAMSRDGDILFAFEVCRYPPSSEAKFTHLTSRRVRWFAVDTASVFKASSLLTDPKDPPASVDLHGMRCVDDFCKECTDKRMMQADEIEAQKNTAIEDVAVALKRGVEMARATNNNTIEDHMWKAFGEFCKTYPSSLVVDYAEDADKIDSFKQDATDANPGLLTFGKFSGKSIYDVQLWYARGVAGYTGKREGNKPVRKKIVYDKEIVRIATERISGRCLLCLELLDNGGPDWKRWHSRCYPDAGE